MQNAHLAKTLSGMKETMAKLKAKKRFQHAARKVRDSLRMSFSPGGNPRAPRPQEPGDPGAADAPALAPAPSVVSLKGVDVDAAASPDSVAKVPAVAADAAATASTPAASS